LRFTAHPSFHFTVTAQTETWFNTVREKDPALKKVYDEVMAILNGRKKDRWDIILSAGLRDEER
jgi:hypothetical protein